MRISRWCGKCSLLITPDKTRVLADGVPQRSKKLLSFSITLFDKELTPVPVVNLIRQHCIAHPYWARFSRH